MNPIFTTNDLLLFHYSELPEERHNAIQLALVVDPQIQEKYNTIVEGLQAIDGLKSNPDKTTVQMILEESQAFGVEVH